MDISQVLPWLLGFSPNCLARKLKKSGGAGGTSGSLSLIMAIKDWVGGKEEDLVLFPGAQAQDTSVVFFLLFYFIFKDGIP